MKIKGCIPALVTPMKEGNPLDKGVNYEALAQLLDYVIKGGVDGILVAGCTGHSASLTWDEQVELMKFVLDYTKGRVKVIAGDGSNCTREAIKAAKIMKDLGIDTHLQISPYQNKPTQEGLYQHYKAIAEAVDGDIIIYNVPGRTGRNIEAETTIKLAKDFNNIVAIKEASGNIEQIRKIIDGTRDLDFSVVSGDDSLTLEIIKSGGTGVITVAGNIDPKRVSEMVHLSLEKKFEEAKIIDDKLRDLYKVLFIETNPSPAHYALRKIGIPVGSPRLPLVDVKNETAKQIDKVLIDLELISKN